MWYDQSWVGVITHLTHLLMVMNKIIHQTGRYYCAGKKCDLRWLPVWMQASTEIAFLIRNCLLVAYIYCRAPCLSTIKSAKYDHLMVCSKFIREACHDNMATVQLYSFFVVLLRFRYLSQNDGILESWKLHPRMAKKNHVLEKQLRVLWLAMAAVGNLSWWEVVNINWSFKAVENNGYFYLPTARMDP